MIKKYLISRKMNYLVPSFRSSNLLYNNKIYKISHNRNSQMIEYPRVALMIHCEQNADDFF